MTPELVVKPVHRVVSKHVEMKPEFLLSTRTLSSQITGLHSNIAVTSVPEIS